MTDSISGELHSGTASESLNFALQAAGTGVWNIGTGAQSIVSMDERCRLFFGLPEEQLLPVEHFLSLVHEEDRTDVHEAIQKALDPQTDGHFDHKMRTIPAENTKARLIRFIGRAYHDSDGIPHRFTGIAMDITAEISPLNDRLQVLVENSPDFMSVSDNDSNLLYLNPAARRLLGIDDADISTLKFFDFYSVEHLPQIDKVLAEYMETGAWYGTLFLKHFQTGEIIPFSTKVKQIIDPVTKEVIGRAGYLKDIRQEMQAQKALSESEYKFRNVTNTSPTGLWLSDPDGGLTYLNQTLIDWTGMPYESLLGTGWANAIIAEDREKSAVAFMTAVANRAHYDVEFRINKANGEIIWCRAAGDPFYHEDGTYGGYAGFCMDIDERVKMLTVLMESEERMRNIVEQAPMAIGAFKGPEFIIESANDILLGLWGKDDAIIGLPMVKALPELEGQDFLELLKEVYTTGNPYYGYETLANLEYQGDLKGIFFDFVYAPLKDQEGQITGILLLATEVSDQVIAKKKLEENEARLRIAIETANLGTWEIHPQTNEYVASDLVKEWFGFEKEENPSFESILKCIVEKDKFIDAVKQAQQKSMEDNVDIEYTVINRKNARKHILHSVGHTFFDEQGEPYLITGSTKDITIHRNTEYELENLVQERTEELQASNEDLEATNEELAESNENLFRSNEELAQYAYVASHDLQEPLRKIRVFSDKLAHQDSLAEENKPIVAKINKASERMSLLIHDLLEFSRLLKSDNLFQPVEIAPVLREVINDFELVVAEKKAVITIDTELPVIDALALQMNQLFYNLLNNALKFVEEGTAPEIVISSRIVSASEIKHYIPRYHRNSRYCDITIRDNGIGFDIKYADQIFEVFKRLHGRDVYQGSGIGLALCRRIVTNHGGHLYAESEPGSGSVFHILLPVID